MQCKFVPSVCSYCGTGCGVLFEVIDGKIVSTLPMKTHPVNQGKLCIKGWNLHEHVNSELRLKQPLVKTFGRFIKADWDEAIGLTADRFRAIIDQHGPDRGRAGVGQNDQRRKLSGPEICPGRDGHQQRRSLRPSLTFLHGGRSGRRLRKWCHDELHFGNRIIGCIFVIGSNTTACHPLIARRIFRAKERGAKLIVADPRNIQLSRFADVAVTHRLGSDVALLNGMMHIIIENGWQADDYIAQRTEDYEAHGIGDQGLYPAKVRRLPGWQPGSGKWPSCTPPIRPATLLYAMGITQHTTGVDNVKSCCNLAMLCGNVGVHGGGVNPLRGQNNVQGACDMGGLPNVMTGYQPVADPQVREKFSKAWGRRFRPPGADHHGYDPGHARGAV
jgi:predicted molibdopterin-dependent oxidoreductase YjgC